LDDAKRIVIRPNESVDTKTFTDREINHPYTSAIIPESEETKLPIDLDISPEVVQYRYRKNGEIECVQPNRKHHFDSTKSDSLLATTIYGRP